MEHNQHRMQRKWDRHYRETPTNISIALMLVGIIIAMCLAVLWPQHYSPTIFNSRLVFHLLIDVEDYWNCNKDYNKFVIDEPTEADALYSIYIFSVTNAPDVMNIGSKPMITETGPYAYRKRTYKYDIHFIPTTSNEVTFKEYNLLDPIVDEDEFVACRRMYYATEKDTSALGDPCADGACDCKSHDVLLTVLNPLFLKLLTEESAYEIIARFSGEVFENIQESLGDDFIEAVKSHLVPMAYSEIGQFRQIVQSSLLLSTGYEHMIDNGYSVEDIQYMMYNESGVANIPTTCGLDIYSVSSCPFNAHIYFFNARNIQELVWDDVPAFTDLPTIAPLLNKTNIYSPLNFDIGMPRYAGVCQHVDMLTFNSEFGFTALTHVELEEIFDALAWNYTLAWKDEDESSITTADIHASKIMIIGFCDYIETEILSQFSVQLRSINQQEFRDTYTAVPCAPSLSPCIWQWGYMYKYGGSNTSISSDMSQDMVDVKTAVNTNPLSLYYASNAQTLYNVYKYCTRVIDVDSVDTSCMDIEYASENVTLNIPAYLWAVDFGIATNNETFLYNSFYNKFPTTALQQPLIDQSCELAKLQYDIYRSNTTFHDDYVIRYLNKFKDPDFIHNFTLGNWEELRYAQWGGGFVTYALSQVRNIYQLKRDGMWRYGDDEYFSNFVEYSSWSVYVGFPQSFIYSVEDSKILLDLLAETSENGVWFRNHIANVGTTYLGNNSIINNAYFNIGEETYKTESNLAHFGCDPNNEHGSYYACTLLNEFYESNATWCAVIEESYTDCTNLISNGNRWIKNCDTIQTSMSAPTFGIQCDTFNVYGEPHPYTKSRGNIIFEMMYSMNMVLVMQRGLWCTHNDDCDFGWGGLFVTTTARQILFEGYTESSVIKYLHLKHQRHNVSFSCVTDSYGDCNVKNYNCSSTEGILMTLPNGESKILSYTDTPKDEYFAPYFVLNQDSGDLIWPFVNDVDRVLFANEIIANDTLNSVSRLVHITNPFYATYPAWHTTDIEFNKYYQCQKRTLAGQPDLFNSCEHILYTGRDDYTQILDIKEFLGNTSIYHYTNATGGIDVSGVTTTNNQHQAYLWNGFVSYPYSYWGRDTGEDYHTGVDRYVFNAQHAVKLKLSQESLSFTWQKEFPVTIPLIPIEEREDPTEYEETYQVRRFIEDENTWLNISLGVPRDTYGMVYAIPPGMSSVENLAGVPAFIGTVHYYGNYKWFGKQYLEVIGSDYTDEIKYRTFVDYDPVIGQSFRTVVRQQVHFRVERGTMFPNIISSQDRCVVPTKDFGNVDGFGCYAYYPLLWFEDSRLINPQFHFDNTVHFYHRPIRAETLSTIGAVCGSVLFFAGLIMYIYEMQHRKRFQARIYVD